MIGPAQSRNGVPPLLEVRGLTVEFSAGRGRPPIAAVDDVSLTVARTETLGLVGESGSGKTTLGRAILGLVPIKAGHVLFDGKDVTRASYGDRRALSADIQAVFQDPYSSLNPARTIGQTLGETLRVHERSSRSELEDRVRSMLEQIGRAHV